MKILLIIAGILLLVFGLFLSLAISIYSVKEQDNDGFIFLLGSGAIVVLGIMLLVKGVNKNDIQQQ